MLIVKVGGGADINLQGVAADLADLDTPAVVVHGANALRDEDAKNRDHLSVGVCQRVL
jgi:acetylglutamate/LysW-gamma-L-alpha-aminoadipate kinase